jgi:quinolinate synthase
MLSIAETILQRKKETNTLILAHYYQRLEVQDVADLVGDSYALAKYAQETDKSAIILCGVRFMAESAKILNPAKPVYLPAADAGCPMADMVTPDDVLLLRAEHPDAAVVCYVNSSAAVKAVSDICCTSSSAVRVVRSLSEARVIFVPDQNLGAYVAAQVPEKEFVLFHGYCPTHHRVTESDMLDAKRTHPAARALVHPECRPEVVRHADYVGSTAGILEHARASDAAELLIGTEMGVIEILRRDCPDKQIFSIGSTFVCPNMKKTSLEDVLRCLDGGTSPLTLPEAEMQGARRSLERMVRV